MAICLNVTCEKSATRSVMTILAEIPTLKDIHADLLFSGEFYLICHKDNVLEQKKSFELKELERHNFIAFLKGIIICIYTKTIDAAITFNML
ncbi:hypothetical protein J3U66_06315 [Gilliamella sp. B2969]|uniref:hypothetical protein n=1 Tax=Gilliamella sp. B2969 TaxID=2818021 RepID=UPI002269A0FA|nr:hypothetical protein [Gilliamella sp. B2969]MCX8729990.1 hypothetical protein [Gilliamella sp. B2969]